MPRRVDRRLRAVIDTAGDSVQHEVGGGERLQVSDLGRGTLAGADRAVHVAAPLGRGLGAGPVDAAHGRPEGGTELGPRARREVRAVAATGPLLPGPVVLDVVDGVGGLR